MKSKIIFEKYTKISREANPDSDYDRGDTYSHWDIKYIAPENDSGWGEMITTEFDLEEGKTYYLLYAIYNTGDSFGQDERDRLEIIDLYITGKAASKALAEIKKAKDDHFTFTNHVGKKVKQYAPWSGYFNSLDELEVMPLVFHNCT